jgi:hypothetical protein
MDGVPKNGTDNNDGGPNKTDPIPVLGGKTQTDVRIQNGQVSLDTMDADLAAAVKSGDEAHVRARLGGDQKLTEAQALILIKTREEEERIAYQQAHPQGAETVDVHRKEGDESIFPWARPNRDWEHDIQTSRFQGQSGSAYTTGAVQTDGFIYERDGSRTDATWGFHQTKDGVITTRGGDVYDVNKNTYTMASGAKGELLTAENIKVAKDAGIAAGNAAADVVRDKESLGAVTGKMIAASVSRTTEGTTATVADLPASTRAKLDHLQVKTAQDIFTVEARTHTVGETSAAIARGDPPPPQTADLLANYQAAVGSILGGVVLGATNAATAGKKLLSDQKPASTKPVKTPTGQQIASSSKHVKTLTDSKTSVQTRTIAASTIAVSAAALDNVGADGTVTVEIPSSIMGVIAQSSSPTKFGSTDAAAVAAEIIDKDERQTQKTAPKTKPAPTA